MHPVCHVIYRRRNVTFTIIELDMVGGLDPLNMLPADHHITGPLGVFWRTERIGSAMNDQARRVLKVLCCAYGIKTRQVIG